MQAGDPSGKSTGGQCVWSVCDNYVSKYFVPETHPKLKHKKKGIVSFVTVGKSNGLLLAGSQFFITLTDDPLEYLDGEHAVFGHVAEGIDVLDQINTVLVDDAKRPFRDIRIKHTIILEDPFDDPQRLIVPEMSPEPTEEMLKTIRIGENEELFEEIDPEQLKKRKAKEEADARALTLEMVGDLPFAEIKPPENVLFVCKLNPVTKDEDLELIFSRFGPVISCEIVKDRLTGESLQYAFVEYENQQDCEEAYFRMKDVLIDDRRIHVDFSQSVSKLHIGYLMGNKQKINQNDYSKSHASVSSGRLPIKNPNQIALRNEGDQSKSHERKSLNASVHSERSRDRSSERSRDGRRDKSRDRTKDKSREHEYSDRRRDGSQWYKYSERRRDSSREGRDRRH